MYHDGKGCRLKNDTCRTNSCKDRFCKLLFPHRGCGTAPMAMLSRDCSEAAPLPRKCCRRPIILYVYFPNCATVGCIKCGICADVVGSAITSANAAGASSSSSSCKFTDLEVTEVFASLEAKRKEWKDASDPEVRDFIVRLMGGKCTREHRRRL